MKNVKWQHGKVAYADRCQLLKQKGMVIWLTGLPGSGKSTIAVELEKQLFNKGHLVYRLDGDNVRHGLNADLSFSEQDRSENIRRVAEVAKLFCDAGVIILASFVTPQHVMRAQAKKIIGTESFIEIYVQASLKTCKKRDPKGFYKKAAQGEIHRHR
jgi:adenylylsulfate kinase